jgi:hypothetical protein
MKEHASHFEVDPYKIKLDSIPPISRTNFKSEEPLGSDNNTRAVKDQLDRAEKLPQNERDYILAIYQELGKKVESISLARNALSKAPFEIFDFNNQGMVDMMIVRKLILPPSVWRIR